MESICDKCELKLNREDCNEFDFKECCDREFNKNLFSIYYKNNNEREEHFYGGGTKEYMCELINDYIATNNMYGKEKITFIIKRGIGGF